MLKTNKYLSLAKDKSRNTNKCAVANDLILY